MMELYRQDGVAGVYYRARSYVPGAGPNVDWSTVSPERAGLDPQRLAALRDALAAQGTNSLLVARNGSLALEWYAPDFEPGELHSLSAAAKGVTGSAILLAAMSGGMLGLDDHVADYVPAWRADPRKRAITIRHLASHSSGLDDVDFTEAQDGWKQEYFEHGGERFRLALERVPVLFEPGTQARYSGVGYYVLAYVIGKVLSEADEPTDIRTYLRDRIMRPLGVPSEDWSLSYGESHEVDGMTLYAIGSGARYTARAIARVGQLFLQHGEWEGRELLSPELVRKALSYSGSPPVPDPASSTPPAGLGWWVNSTGIAPSLPPDAVVAIGGGHQVLVLVPSRQLLALRLGSMPLGREGEPLWAAAEEQFFAPLMDAVALDD